jgi:phosphomannomutase
VQTLVTPVSSNTVAEACGHFAQVLRTRIGSPYVVAAMQEALALRPTDTVAGFDANGGFLLMSDVRNAQGAVLWALPTRDALLPMLAVLAQAVQAVCPVSALQEHLPARFTASDRLQNFSADRSALLLAQMVQDPSAWLLRCLGAGATLAQVDQTDGVRMRLKSGEFVHLRPSGNAPELRCYSEADSELRAVALTAQVLAFVRVDTLVL